ncbi:hypothetical protein CDAR_429031 [Caerostris darwini]|uniref:Uncharacterized protein n=1 Tax=Caerostris darwini TaxID=1538125 RepID=A0AAV4TXI8_9ARAC|nr:hypothetical protein CDAR_429031 [Caerostris darwini]
MRSLRLLITQHLSNFNCRRRRNTRRNCGSSEGQGTFSCVLLCPLGDSTLAGTLSCHDQKRVTPSAFQWVRIVSRGIFWNGIYFFAPLPLTKVQKIPDLCFLSQPPPSRAMERSEDCFWVTCPLEH